MTLGELSGQPFDQNLNIWDSLGRGGFGEVYRAHRHSGVKKPHERALKILDKNPSNNPPIQRKPSLHLIQHPHIAKFYDSQGSGKNGQPHIMMQMVEGPTLSRIIQIAGALEPSRSLRIAKQMADALHYLQTEALHGKPIIHADIKPENIIVDRRGGEDHAVLIDLDAYKVSPVSVSVGLIPHTARYAPPELLSRNPRNSGAIPRIVDVRADIYLVVASLWEALTGRAPFRFNRPTPHDQPPDWNLIDDLALPPGIPKKMKNFLQKGLHADPDSRFQTASEIIAEIDYLLSTSGEQGPQSEETAPL